MFRWIRWLYAIVFICQLFATTTKRKAKRQKAESQNVYVLIPARNEQGSIAATLESLEAQSHAPADILVVANNCDDEDETAAIAKRYGAQVIEMHGNMHKKAGALNRGLDDSLKTVSEQDFVLIMDADSYLVPGFVEAALKSHAANPKAGAICASFAGEPGRSGIIHSLQRSEYARFARSISRRRANAQVLSGVATLFPVSLLKEIGEARKDKRLPAAPGIYEVTAATEDIEMTYAVRQLGYRPLAPKDCLAYTDTMDSWLALKEQRIRWQRGMLDSLWMYGLNRQTVPYAIRLTGMYLSSLAAPFYLAMIATTYLVFHHVGYQPLWLGVIPLFCFERWWTVRHVGRREALMAALLIPEWLYDNYRAVVYWTALVRWIRRAERVWIPT
jgi:cellulose synthase/poly-beta-1,6-N-acetylglucosamine synthase-like glycosyltransferase